MNIYDSILRGISRVPILEGCLTFIVGIVFLGAIFFDAVSGLHPLLQIIVVLLLFTIVFGGFYLIIRFFPNPSTSKKRSGQAVAPRGAANKSGKTRTNNGISKAGMSSARFDEFVKKNRSAAQQQTRARKLTQEDIDLCRKFNLQQAEKAAGNLPEAYAKTLLSGKRAELMDNYKLAFLRYKAVADAGYFEGMYFLVWLCCHKMNDWHQGFHWTEKALAFCPDYTSEEAHFLLSELCTIVGDRDLVDREHLLTNEERLHAEGLLAAYGPESDADVLQMLDGVEGGYNDNLNVNADAHHHTHIFSEDLDREEIEDLFGNYNEYDRDISDDRRHRARGSANWTSREDWDCGNSHEDGLSGFDNYEDNDF